MSNIKAAILSFVSVLISVGALAQEERLTVDAPFDSSNVVVRHFSDSTVAELKNNPDLNYGVGPAGLTFWERFIRWLGSFFEDVADSTAKADWFEIFIIVSAIAILVYVILRLLRIDALKMFYGNRATPLQARALDENIHEMDFEKLLAEALRNNDFRLATRLLFLHSLKILSDKQHIRWQPGKTNHDYVNELEATQLKPGFDELNYYFEYAWYGNFNIAPDLFARVRNTFNNWKEKV